MYHSRAIIGRSGEVGLEVHERKNAVINLSSRHAPLGCAAGQE